MRIAGKAIETTGIVEGRNLVLDDELPIYGPAKVRVIILLPVEEEAGDIDEAEWMRIASADEAFDFLREPEEDVYTLEDGRPFHDQG